jgi:hypothetical protein
MINDLESRFRIEAGPSPWIPSMGAAVLIATDTEGEIDYLICLQTDGEGNVLQDSSRFVKFGDQAVTSNSLPVKVRFC